MPETARFKNDVGLIAKCHYFWEASGFQKPPNIREIAEMDMDYLDDLMLYDRWVGWIKGKSKGKQ